MGFHLTPSVSSHNKRARELRRKSRIYSKAGRDELKLIDRRLAWRGGGLLRKKKKEREYLVIAAKL